MAVREGVYLENLIFHPSNDANVRKKNKINFNNHFNQSIT